MPDGLRQVRSHVLAGILPPGGSRVPPPPHGLKDRDPALRPLHHRRDAVQVSGWIPHGEVFGEEFLIGLFLLLPLFFSPSQRDLIDSQHDKRDSYWHTWPSRANGGAS